MIAKVKIAPESEWCHHQNPVVICRIPEANRSRLVGMSVEILTETMRSNEVTSCGGRTWMMTEESHKALNEVAGIDDENNRICEHILDMD